MSGDRLEFGSVVRVRVTDETVASGIAEACGAVVGSDDDDYAIAVWFDDRGDHAWIITTLLEPAGRR